MLVLKIFLAGWVILIVAIILNFLAARMGMTTWYPFFEDVQKTGFMKAFQDTNPLSKIFMFLIYPALLGISGYLVLKLFK